MIVTLLRRSNQIGIRLEAILMGAVTNFFDTLGIGSFAPSIAWMRMRKLIPDRLIPLTMLAGYIIPSLLQGLIFMTLLGVKVDLWLILGCVGAMIADGYFSPALRRGRRSEPLRRWSESRSYSRPSSIR